MRGLVYLAWKYISAHRGRTFLLVLCIAASLYVPWVASRIATRYDQDLRSRAGSTPLVVGAPGNRYDLTLASLYFRANELEPLSWAEYDDVDELGLAVAIPLHLRYTARGKSLVGTSPEYYEFRGLAPTEGRDPLRLGECALGANVARELGLGPGDAVFSDPVELFDISRPPALKMRISGVYAPTGTPDDDAIFCDVRTSWVIDGIAHGHADEDEVDEELIVAQTDGSTVYNPALLEYAEVTPENEASFHYHGDPEGLPITSIIAVPPDVKSETLLLTEVDSEERTQCVPPAAVIDDLLGVVFRVKRTFDLVATFLIVTTALLVGLVFLLSTRLRASELHTLDAIGAPRRAALTLIGLEIVWVAIAATALAFLATELTLRWLPDLVATF